MENVLRRLKGVLNSISDDELDYMDLFINNDFEIKEIKITSASIKLITDQYNEQEIK